HRRDVVNASVESPLLSTAQALPVVADEVPVPRLRRLMLKALSLPIAVMLLLCALLAVKVGAEVVVDARVSHARAVIAEAQRAQQLVFDQEAALRGYVIGHEDMYLTPLHVAHTTMPAALERLEALVAGDPTQQARVAALVSGYDRWAAATGLEPAGDALGRPSEASRLQLGTRAAQLDAVQQQVREVVDLEQQRLHQAEAAGLWFGAPMAVAAALVLALIA